MRLIDADTLSDIFETKVCRGCSSECITDEYGCSCSIHYMKELLWQQPTAYDVDKVVDKIQREKSPDLVCHTYYNNALDSAIDIVKRGGIDK